MPAFREMLFATAGFGRIARAVLERAHAFGFRLGAYDPFVPENVMLSAGIIPLSRDELFAKADVLSLHMPLTPENHHFVSKELLESMKPSAILINTSRGALVDTRLLAHALEKRTIAYAGIDVFETEPLGVAHSIRACENALLTSHMAWYSEQSVPRLQRMAAEEVARGLRGEPLKNQVNR
jgi:D-3-phosphoglycerate dehydrogenase